MPQVLVFGYNGLGQEMGNFEVLLRHIIAEALNVPGVEGAQLSDEDVEVDFVDSESYGKDQIRILVFANYFKEREDDLQTVRVPEIAALIKRTLNGEKGYVYVRLAPAGFCEF